MGDPTGYRKYTLTPMQKKQTPRKNMLTEIYMTFEGIAADTSFLGRLCLNSDVRAMVKPFENVTRVRISENDGQNSRSMNSQL